MNSIFFMINYHVHFIYAEEFYYLLHPSKDADAQGEVGSAVQSVFALCEQYTQVSSISSGLYPPHAPSSFS